MNTRYLFSGSLALGLHVGLLFGFRTAPAAPRGHPSVTAEPAPTIVVTPPEDVYDATNPENETPAGAAAPRPHDRGLPELPLVMTDVTPGLLLPMLSPIETAYRVSVGAPPSSWSGTGPDGVGFSRPGVFSPGAVDELPRAVYQARPIYPSDMRRDGIAGEVRLAFVVGRDGTVRDAEVVSSTARSFEEPALRAIRAWKFKPGIKGGAPVATRMMVPMLFTLADN